MPECTDVMPGRLFCLREKSRFALQMGKTAFYKMSGMGYEDSLAYLSEMFSLLCATEDAKEGIDAFLNKKSPQWKGH